MSGKKRKEQEVQDGLTPGTVDNYWRYGCYERASIIISLHMFLFQTANDVILLSLQTNSKIINPNHTVTQTSY